MIPFNLLEPMLWHDIMSYLDEKDNRNLLITFSVLAKKNKIFIRHADSCYNKIYNNILKSNNFLQIITIIYKNLSLINNPKTWIYYYSKFFDEVTNNHNVKHIYEAIYFYNKIFNKKIYFKSLYNSLNRNLYYYDTKFNKSVSRNNINLIVSKLIN